MGFYRYIDDDFRVVSELSALLMMEPEGATVGYRHAARHARELHEAIRSGDEAAVKLIKGFYPRLRVDRDVEDHDARVATPLGWVRW